MTSQQQNFMTEWMDEAQDVFRAGMSAGTRLAEVTSKAISQTPHFPVNAEEFRSQNERLVNGLAPFMERNLDVCVKAFNTQMRTNLNVWNQALKPDADRPLWKSGFELARDGINAAVETGAKMMENWTQFCNTTCTETSKSPKTESRTAK